MTLGIAFAGGGARGAAHLGVLQALEENNIVADCYAGTSAGSIIAAMKALGKSNQECLDMAKKASVSLIDVAIMDIIKSLPHKLSTLEGLAKGDNMKKYLSTYIGETSFLRNVKKPLSIVSTDINTGTQVVFSSEDLDKRALRRIDDKIKAYDRYTPLNLPNIVYASSSIPGVFQPITYNKMKLVDGSVTNNIPSDLLKLMGADKVIAINLTLRTPENPKVNGIFNILGQAAVTMIEQNEFLSLTETENVILLNPDITDIGILDFDKAMEAYQAGYDYGTKMIDTIKKKLES
jgi:NTE family protein